jgi:hypothetical protein
MIAAALLMIAQATPTPTCSRIDAVLPPALAGWRVNGDDLASGRSLTIAAVEPAAARLSEVPAPTRPGKMTVASLTVTRAGSYGIALDQPAWIDLYPVRGAAALTSTTHGHGPACTSIRKIVRFTLAPGTYFVVVSGMQQPLAKLMLVRG